MDKTQPALIVQHGNTAQKHRPIDRAGITLGQARGCDIELDAPEVSNIHCIITRGADGLYARDCTSRTGTRVNGERIREAYLHEGDILQIGPFSFQIYLPEAFVTQPERGPALMASTSEAAPAQAIDPDLDKTLAEKEGELEQKEKDLQNQLRDFEEKKRKWEETKNVVSKGQENVKEHSKKAEAKIQQLEEELKQRQGKLQQSEQELTKRQSQIQHAEEELKQRLQHAEQELKQRRNQTETEIRDRLKECQQRCEEMERAQAEATKKGPSSAHKSGVLDVRQKELDNYARQLQELEQSLREEQEKLRQEKESPPPEPPPPLAQPVVINQEVPGLADIKEEILAAIAGQQEVLGELRNTLQKQNETLAGLSSPQESSGQWQAVSEQQHSQLTELLGELKSLQLAGREQQTTHLEALRQAILLLNNQIGRGGRDAQSSHASATDLSTAPVESKPKEKLSERLRAIEAKIPAIGSRSRHG
jgi:pSer/pThr/pTyr-binding forkhead associated (FHA) protein